MNTRLPLQFAVFAQMNDVLDEALAVVIARMRFAGENELHRALLDRATSFTMFSNCWKISGARL